MITKKRFLILSTFLVGMLVVALALTAGTAAAGSTGDGPTLSVPDSYASCEPGPDKIVLSEIPDGYKGQIDVRRFFPDNSSKLLASTGSVEPDNGMVVFWFDAYPPVDQWDVNPDTGERQIVLAVEATVLDDGSVVKKLGAKWTVTCKEDTPPPPPPPPPPPEGGEGCTPGYWRQGHHFDSWVDYSPDDDFDSVFGVASSFGPATLGEAVQLGGGGENALARHAVAALLNAANPDVDYAFTTEDVINRVQDAYASGDFESVKDEFEAENEAGCPLN